MSDIKKYLDYEGVKYLWSKINMQDYPNNETLINIINAIDETKADKSELVQSDWTQTDETALDFIKNKPDIATDEDVDSPKIEFILKSSTEGSTKKFKITIDDDGVLTATEIVESEA